jgi:uncharacterized protein YggL (DUF469 family)
MRKRLRKKLRLQEFQEMGFYVDFDTNLPLEEDWSPLWVAFGKFLKTQGLKTECCYMTRPGRYSATDADREAVAAWLHQQPGVAAVKAWPLDDAWYGPFDWL